MLICLKYTSKSTTTNNIINNYYTDHTNNHIVYSIILVKNEKLLAKLCYKRS